jgi:DnaB-like helicase N terminal domain
MAEPNNGRSSGQGNPSSQVAKLAVDEDAERAVLGAIFLYGDPRRVLRLLGKGLVPESFYWERNGAVFSATVALAKRDVGPDPITVYAEMENLGITGVSKQELEELAGWAPSAGNVGSYADRVIEQAQWRERLRVTRMMLAAVEQRDSTAWEASVAPFLPESEQKTTQGPSILRLVDESGTIVSEEVHCDGCEKLQDQLDGASREIAGWRTRFANLKRDKEADARKDALWLPAQALFEHWKKLTGHRNSKWTPDRFYAAEPMLKKYGCEVFERAIAGISHDPYKKLRANGTTQKYDSWATLTKNSDAFEEYANRAPKGWKATLKLVVEEVPVPQALALVQEAS